MSLRGRLGVSLGQRARRVAHSGKTTASSTCAWLAREKRVAIAAWVTYLRYDETIGQEMIREALSIRATNSTRSFGQRPAASGHDAQGWASMRMLAGNRLRRLFSARPRVTVTTAQVPDGVRVYAIGDIHGRLDLLQRLHDKIAADAATATAMRRIVVYLGDYVDRGLNSREVVDFLLDQPLASFESVHLRGNHDQQLLDFLTQPATGALWLRYGGDATLYSYGIRFPESGPKLMQLQIMSAQLKETIPARHLAFFDGLKLTYELGDFLFVHAGIHPEKTMEQQTLEDMLWIRDEFLESDFDLGKVVIHGHSVTERPEIRDNRIGVDTGAVFSNTLTCLVLEANSQRFLSTREP